MKRLALSALDFGLVGKGRTAHQTLQTTLEQAARLDELGYRRYWLGEHHLPNVAWAAPEILVSVVAGVTERMRVGAACVLLNYNSPFKVTESFRALSALYPGRIDLGVGAGVVDANTARALRGGLEPAPEEDGYGRKVAELVGHLRGGFPEDHPYHTLRAAPLGVDEPELWLMGGRHTAHLAARHGASLCYPLFFPSGTPTPEVVQEYRARFQPSPTLAEPQPVIAVAGICVETEAEAARWRKHLEALETPFVRCSIVDTPERCHEYLSELAHRYQVEELAFLNFHGEPTARLRAYELLAARFGLEQAG